MKDLKVNEASKNFLPGSPLGPFKPGSPDIPGWPLSPFCPSDEVPGRPG